MPTASARAAVLGFGKQSAEGTALSVPKFEIPMGNGFAGPERETDELPWTNDGQDSIGAFISRIGGVVDATLPVLPVSAGALLEAVLGGRATTGDGPYSHALTPSDSLPFLTFFYGQPGGNFWTVEDTKVGSWELSWEPGQPLEVSIAGMGKAVTRAGSKWGAATLEESVDPHFTYISAAMKFAASGDTPATVHNIAGGSISVNRNLDAIQTDRIHYDYMAEQKRDIEVSLDDVVFEDNDLINTVFTGSTTGTEVSGAIVYGSCEFTFIGSDGTAAATRSLKLALPRVAWTIDQVPRAEPDGGTLRYTVTGRASKPTSGAIITATLINGSAAAVYA